MRRRAFLTFLAFLVAGATTAPLAAQGRQKPAPVIGFLSTRTVGVSADIVTPFRKGLGEAGFVEGQNLGIEYRWAEGHYDRLPALAAGLVKLPVAVLVTAGGPLPARAAEKATSTIPIVFVSGADPVKFGLVHSFSRPDGNATGVDIVTHQLAAKRLGLLHELVPKATVAAALIDPHNLNYQGQAAAVRKAAGALGLQANVMYAGNDAALGAAFATMARDRVQALLVAASPYFNTRRKQIVALAARYRLPALYQFREFATAGGLASYGPNLREAYRQAGRYAGRILRGAEPADLPVVISDKFDLVINLKTARALGLAVPRLISVQADEVIP